MIRLSQTGIEYLTHVWNFYSGCKNDRNGVCAVGDGCWAKGIIRRFKGHYPNGFEPTLYPEAILSPLGLKKPARIGCAFMGDLFGDWVDPNKAMSVPLEIVVRNKKYSLLSNKSLRQTLFDVIEVCPQHQYLFLTKCAQNLARWSPFPANCGVGVSSTEAFPANTPLGYLKDVVAGFHYMSIEPLLKWPSDMEPERLCESLLRANVKWVIIGQKTPVTDKTRPQVSWIRSILKSCDMAKVPAFVKDNIINDPVLFNSLHIGETRQQYPSLEVKKCE